MRLFAGIDGGQSSTVAVLADESGRIIGTGSAGPCDHIGQDPASRRFADALEAALGEARRRANASAGDELEAVVAGISGFEGVVHGPEPDLGTRLVKYLHDAPVAHAGAFALGPGIVVIAGTGSVAYGTTPEGRFATTGGWGYLFGDEGSAFAIARDAVASAMRAEDAVRGSALGEAAVRWFGTGGLRELARAFYTGSIERPAFAGFAAEVIRLGGEGHPEAEGVLDRAAAGLAELAATCAARLDGKAAGIALTGGTFADRRFRERVEERMRAALPGVPAVRPRHSPAAGALLLAYKEAGLRPPRLTGLAA